MRHCAQKRIPYTSLNAYGILRKGTKFCLYW